MPLPPEVEGIADPLIALYQRAWERVVAEQQRIAMDPVRFRRRARLEEVRAAIEREMDLLREPTRDWLRRQFPRTYALGVANGVASTGGAVTGWTTVHRQAVQTLASDLFDDLLGATQHVTDDAKRLIRDVIRDQALQKAIAGDTAVNAAKQARRVIEQKGISAVVYRNGARHSLADYAEMAMRSTTAIAYNHGTLNADLTVQFFEILDGPECGLSFHEDPVIANGLVVDRDTAFTYTISHPRCRRAFGPRPDITTAQQALRAKPSVTEEQLRDQLRADLERKAAQDRRRANRRRPSRPPRSQRGPSAKKQARTQRIQSRHPGATPPAPTLEPASSRVDISAIPNLEPARADIEAAVNDLGRVLQLPTSLPQVPIDVVGTGGGVVGFFDPNATRIGVGRLGPWRRLTTSHEFGHYLHQWGFGGGHTFPGPTDLAELQGWSDAVEASTAVTNLRAAVSSGEIELGGLTLKLGPSDVAHIRDYMLKNEELWARSFAQYIATKSTDKVLKKQLRKALLQGMHHQWEDADFTDILAAFDQLFESKGWTIP